MWTAVYTARGPRMSGHSRQTLSSLVLRGRDSAIVVISRFWPGEDFTSIEARLDRQTLRIQAEVTLSVLGYLFLLALFAGQFGPIGLMLFFVAVLITVR